MFMRPLTLCLASVPGFAAPLIIPLTFEASIFLRVGSVQEVHTQLPIPWGTTLQRFERHLKDATGRAEVRQTSESRLGLANQSRRDTSEPSELMEAQTTEIVRFEVTETFPLVLAIILREWESPIPGEVESHANLKFFQGGPSGTLLLEFDNPDDFHDSNYVFRRTLNPGTYTFVGTTSLRTLREDVSSSVQGSFFWGPYLNRQHCL